MSSHSNYDDEMKNDFINEVSELLRQVEQDCLEIEKDLESKELLDSLFRSFHTIKGLAGFIEESTTHEIAHSTESILDKLRKGNATVNSSVIDLILLSSDLIKTVCQKLSSNMPVDESIYVLEHMKNLSDWVSLLDDERVLSDSPLPLGEIMLIEGKLGVGDLQSILLKQAASDGNQLFGQIAVTEGKVSTQQVVESLRKQKALQKEQKSKADDSATTMRITSEKVDHLVDMMGELLILQAVMEEEAKKRFSLDDAFMQSLIRNLRITKQLQDSAMSLRMISIKSLLQRAQRIGRDAAKTLNKSVSFTISGEETETDRNVAEKLAEPLMHLVRNCVGHGIEEPQARVQKGKPEIGKIDIQAYTKRGYVYIEIKDDGQGIDTEKIHKTALSKNLIDPTITYSKNELIDLIFLPGFSTAKDVDSISGRGVGLDVVKTEIAKLGGKIEVKSELSVGTSFTIKLPVNLAVISGTIVSIRESYYVIPTLSIKKITVVKKEDWVTVNGKKKMIRQRGDIISLISLEKVFDNASLIGNLVVILEHEGKFAALPIDEVKEKRDIVVKSLAQEFQNLGYASGATILGDGTVSLILDVEYLLQLGGENVEI